MHAPVINSQPLIVPLPPKIKLRALDMSNRLRLYTLRFYAYQLTILLNN